MQLISTSMGFYYGGYYSVDYDLTVASIDSSPYSYQAGINYDIQMSKANNRDVVNFYGVNKKLLEFDFQIFKTTVWTIEDRKDIMNIFFQNAFRDLYFADDDDSGDHYTNIIFNCMPNGKVEAIDFGGMYGMSIPMICSTPYALTEEINQYFDLSTNTTTTDIEVRNYGNLQNEPYYNIEIDFTLVDAETDISLVNNNDSGRECAFTGLTATENIIINNYTKEITSDTASSRISEFNKTWFRLVAGINTITVTGKCLIAFTARYPIII